MTLKEYNSDLWYFLLAMKDKHVDTYWWELFGNKALYDLNKEELVIWMGKCNELAKEDINKLKLNRNLMKTSLIAVVIGLLCVFLIASIGTNKNYKPKPLIQFPIVNNANIGDSIAFIRHWALIDHKIDGVFVYFHYKQTKTDSLRRIVAGYDEKGIWTIFDDKTYIKP